MNFKPSDKVVCLNNFYTTPLVSGTHPKKGIIYVVRDTDDTAIAADGSIGQGLLLAGIVGALNRNGREWCFCATQFRKLEEIQAENKLKREQEKSSALKEATQLINSEP